MPTISQVPAFTLMSGVAPEQVRAEYVSADYFLFFGAPVIIGRTFTDDDDKPGGPKLVVITSGFVAPAI